jgi:uncharacterized protein YbcV (DUF1398 family)
VKTSVQKVIEQCLHDSHAGTASFGSVVATLAEAGVESYHADYRQRSSTYYMPDGATISLALNVPDVDIPQAFNAAAVLAAIRGAQRGEVKYPQFIALSMAAGCISYIVWITGRHVTYFGRRGEVHIERFPDNM